MVLLISILGVFSWEKKKTQLNLRVKVLQVNRQNLSIVLHVLYFEFPN